MNEQPTDPAGTQSPSTPERRRARRIVRSVLSLVVAAVLLAGVLPQLADFSDVWASIRSLTAFELATLFAAAAWNIATYLFVIVAALPGVSLGQAFVASQISTAVSNTMPAGSALGVGVTYAIYSSWGLGAARITLAAVVMGLWNTFVKLGLPIVALAILALGGRAGPALVSASLVGLAVLAGSVALLVLVTSSERLAASIGDALGRAVSAVARPFGRGPFEWAGPLAGFRRRSAGLLRTRWAWITLTTLVSHLSLFLLLLVSLRHLGVPSESVPWPEVLGAFALVRLVTALPITPGGLGVVELGLTAALVAAGGPEIPVVAAVLVYRALSYLLQVPLGVVSYVIWQRRSAWRVSSDPRAPHGLAAP